jgi:hypothetical protein
MTHIVIGLGEVGLALQSILQCDGFAKDSEPASFKPYYDVIHICFPYSEDFERQVLAYKDMFRPRYIVIHSTVPIGTSKKLKAIHSPIRGKHPNLEPSIRAFIKYVAGPGSDEIADELRDKGIPAASFPNSDDTEAGKLFDLMQYGMTILIEKEIYKYCQEHGLDFNVAYKNFNVTYNMGYAQLGNPQFIRPVLDHVEGKIGGHCVVQMMELLDSESAKKIINENKKL